MSAKALENLIKTFFALLVLFVVVGLWYYAFGRKPKLAVSAKFTQKSGQPVARLIGPGEVVLLLGSKVTLYNVGTGAAAWSADLHNAAAPAQPAPAQPVAQPVAAPAPAAKPAPVAKAAAAPTAKGAAAPAAKAATATGAPAPVAAAPDDKPDPLLVKRVERRFAKLEAWAAKLNQKRATLKTNMQVEAFNVEAAKYHAELAEARAEAAPLHKAEMAAAAPAARAEVAEAFVREREEGDEMWFEKTEVMADGATLWILQGSHVVALDRASGHVLKDVPLAGNFADAYLGPDCLYVAATAPGGGRQVARLTTADARVLPVAGPAALPRYSYAGAGLPDAPNIQPLRTEFRAAHSELLEADIRLIESKVIERKVMSGDAVSDMEEADKKTTGGWASDAAIISQSMAKEGAREVTGGKERTDESTYEVTLRRPFAAGSTPSAPVRVQGRPEIFSTTSLDLVIAGQTLVAYDHASKKLWESKLAQPISFSDVGEGQHLPNASTATLEVPCLEDSERLYLFDKAFLNTFERATGKLLWRIPSIGIHKVQLDGKGTIYIVTSNGTEDSLHGFGGNTVPLTIKADAKTGRIAWKLEKYEDCFVSGGDLYASRETRNGEDAVNEVFDRSKAPETRFKLYKLSTRNGEPQWEWFQTRRPLSIESEGKKVSILFRDELQVIKSIAL